MGIIDSSKVEVDRTGIKEVKEDVQWANQIFFEVIMEGVRI